VNVPIRHAEPGDCDELAALVERYWVFEHIGGFDRDRIVRLLNRFVSSPAEGRCWVAGEAGALRGYLLATYLFSLEFGGTIAEIDELYVIDQHRAEGLGTRLVQYGAAEMRLAGVVHLQLQLGSHNRSGREFYSRLGFAARPGYELLGKRL
jgi:GNAT superfamily N-acetyltransferase